MENYATHDQAYVKIVYLYEVDTVRIIYLYVCVSEWLKENIFPPLTFQNWLLKPKIFLEYWVFGEKKMNYRNKQSYNKHLF